MRIFAKVMRWLIAIFAVTSVLGYVMSSSASRNPSDGWVALVWAIVGSVAVYFELKSSKKLDK